MYVCLYVSKKPIACVNVFSVSAKDFEYDGLFISWFVDLPTGNFCFFFCILFTLLLSFLQGTVLDLKCY